MAEENEEIEEKIELSYLDLEDWDDMTEEQQYDWILNMLEHATRSDF
jgi:hypothetical protein|tara:strand:+ start:304 stop:444 length:141 start_codon:yes stop_codon:yes gene_type:complete